MSTATTQAAATAEAEIRKLVDSYVDAVRASDVDRIASHYAPDILAFDAIAQLQFKGVDAYKKHWQACMAMCGGMGVFELHEPNIAVSGDVAFGHWLCRCGAAADESGKEKTGWTRGTLGFRKVADGRWVIVHEHWSAPFDMESGKAMLDLQP